MDPNQALTDRTPPQASAFALVLSGGLALGAFQAGVLAALAGRGRWPSRIVGSSTGALNAAVALGGPVETAPERLWQLWFGSADLFAGAGAGFGGGPWSMADAGARFLSAAETLGLGRAGLFRPRPVPLSLLQPAAGHMSLAPLQARLLDLVDFDRLNAGPVSACITATDLETGEAVVLDTATGPLGPADVAASCAMPPLFAPVERQGRLLGDGGLTANTPVGQVLGSGLPAIGVDLLPRPGERPASLSEGASRAAAIAFATQTWTVIDAAREAHGLRERLARAGEGDPPAAVHLAIVPYVVPGEEPGVARLLDYRADVLSRRWVAGESAAMRALERLESRPSETFRVEVCP